MNFGVAWNRALCWVFLSGAVVSAVGAQDHKVVSAHSADLPEVARSLPLGGELRVEGIVLEEGAGSTALILRRFRVFTPEAKIVVHGSGGTETLMAVPDNARFQGWMESEPNSVVLLTVREGGGMRGIVASRGRYWVVAGGPDTGGPETGLRLREIDAEAEFFGETASWSCATDELQQVSGALDELFLQPGPSAEWAAEPPGGSPLAVSHTARIAVETDFEFYQRFGDSTDATDYIGDVIGYGSILYSAEVDTSWEIELIHLYTAPADPWNESSSLCALFEFGRYWNDNYSAVDRTIVHMMSGKSAGGGVAWVGVLCRGPFNYDHLGACPSLSPASDNYGGDYGFSGGLSGSFNIDNPAAVWDIVVVTHEIGHNFNSPHTHCYSGISGPDPIDQCYNGQCGSSGCYCGSESLPAGCPGSGQGCGTIMSYCHTLTGGLSNISLTLGTGHPYGVDPVRAPNRMSAHVQSVASSNPVCLAPVGIDQIFVDGFESGGTSVWSSTEP